MSLNAIVESIIFTADSAISLDRLAELLPEYERGEIREALTALAELHEQRQAGIQLVEVAGGWQFRTRPAMQDFIVRQVKNRQSKFSQSALETLAIVAYRQPVTRAEIEYLRGVDTGGVLKTLLERKLIRILGKKDIPGRPIIYGTTREFLELFGLKDLKGLPTLKEIQALDEAQKFEQQGELPLQSEEVAA